MDQGILMTDELWQRTDNWVGSQIDDAFVMLDFEAGTYVSLNTTATEIWDTLESPASAGDIVARLTARFDVEEAACAASVDRMLVELSDKGLIKRAA
jgi:hypothetical protein